MAAKTDYDLIIVGAGPGGLAAGLYARRASLSTVIIEKAALGGSITNADLVENFPAFPEGISGSRLSAKMVSQVTQLGIEFRRTEVTEVQLRDGLKWVTTGQGDYSAQALIIAGGARSRKLGIPGEEEFVGRGVSYCAMCDGGNFVGQEVAIIGGGDGGITEGLYMTRIASQVTVIEILPKLSATRILQERAYENPKLKILCSTTVEAITAEGNMKNLSLKNVETGERFNLKFSGVFVLVGLEPQTEYLRGLVELDSEGYIIVTNAMETSVLGIFAAGDIRSGSARQAITAAGDVRNS